MWSLALASLAALAVAVDCACPEINEPLNKTMRRLTMNGSMTWSEVDVACRKEFGSGFVMLDRDFLFLSDTDKALCQGHSVPLRLAKVGLESVVWPRSKHINYKEEVNSTYLVHMRTDKVAPLSSGWQVGALDLSTGQWRLVDNSSTFSCAICQRTWVKYLVSLKLIPPRKPKPFGYAYNFGLQETGNNSIGLDEALYLAEQRLNKTLTSTGGQVHAKITQVASKPGDGNWTSLRLKATWRIDPRDVLGALNGSYSLKYWQRASLCPASSVDGLFWDEVFTGFVSSKRLRNFHVATRRCSWRMYPDGDWDSAWEDEVLLWIDREEECRSLAVSNLEQRLQSLAARVGPSDKDLKSLVEITAGYNGAYNNGYLIRYTIGETSPAIFDFLSSLLVATGTNVNTSSACQGNAFALLAVDFQGVIGQDCELVSSKDLTPRFFELNQTSDNDRISYVSLQLPQELTSPGRVALHVWRDLKLFYDISMTAQIVSSLPFNESEPERSRPQVTIRINNTEKSSNHSRWNVCSLSNSKEPTLPCPLVRSEGSIDTYTCNKWTRGPSNFTVGTFLAYTACLEFGRLDYEHFMEPVLVGYTTIPLDESALLKVAEFTSEIRHPMFYRKVNFMHPWLDILSGVVLTEPVITVSLEHVKVLVSDLNVNDPVLGLSFNVTGAVQTVTASSRNMLADSLMDLVLKGDVQEHCEQLAMFVVDVEGFDVKGSLGSYIKRKLKVVHVLGTLRSRTEPRPENIYFEIQLQSERGGEEKVTLSSDKEVDTDRNKVVDVTHNESQFTVVKTKQRFQVATWSEADGDWSVSSCAKLRSTRAAKSVVRCESLTFAANDLHDRYLVFEPVEFAEALGPTLLTVLIAAGVVSGVSLVSIASTAVFLPHWQKDMGHKILLQMALALSFNLGLGFTTSFVSVDTTSVACVVIGALRHFSYLAMFAWMLVMSGLQLRRLLSMLGAKNTSYLLLKVSLFAWGVPAFAVGSLLTFKLDMYQSDAEDRGYCYPEGTAFTWSVQVPAATVLALNAIIFLVILARLYSFRGWGKTADLRRHKNERAFQMRRVRAVFFTFFLFGITWLFHLLAEQGVFKVKYLYEYLFLMTASVHVFSLSCIFVFFDREARAEWAQVVAPVGERLATSIVSLSG